MATEERVKILIWSGPKHFGKTAAAAELAERARQHGLAVAGVLQPSVRQAGSLVGFDVVDILTGRRVALARVADSPSPSVGKYAFKAAGLALGLDALRIESTRQAVLVIVDEFGPLELAGKGWRKEVDLLLEATDALLVLVVREELQEKVQHLYKNYPSVKLVADRQQSINKVIDILRNRYTKESQICHGVAKSSLMVC